jgi:hypothetical protein
VKNHKRALEDQTAGPGRSYRCKLEEGKLRELYKEQEKNVKKFPLISHTLVSNELAITSEGEEAHE